MSYAVEMLADSVGPSGVRLSTLKCTFPRFILAELNTHRMLSRSSASSRAVPVEKRIREVRENPFVPKFRKNKRGMQAGDPLDSYDADLAQREWLNARYHAIRAAEGLADCGAHKQWANRLLEPFLWHTAILTGTDWDNFLALRTHSDAQPEFQKLALMIKQALADSQPQPVAEKGWHLPFVTLADLGLGPWDLARVCAARCARVSYLTQDGRRDIEADLALAARLLKSGHMSPFEHVAMASASTGYCGNLKSWIQYRKLIPGEDVWSSEE